MNEVDPNTNPSVAAVDDGYDQLSLEENEHGLSARSILWISLCVSFLFCFLPLFVIFVMVPAFFMIFPKALMALFFLTFVRSPKNLTDLAGNNVSSIGSAFYLRGEAGKIGVWHTIPRSIATLFRRNGTLPNGDEMRNMLSMQEYPVFIYLHGTTFDRANWHRIILYNLLNDMDYHVIAFDYRGYGDSDGTATEHGVLHDSRVVYNYVKENCKNNTVIIWGHSMGSAITTRMAKELSLEGQPPYGIVLEGAYDNLRNAFMTNWFSFPLHWVPDSLIQLLVVDRLADVGLTMMRSDEHIKRVACPILMLHAEDDHIVKVSLARALRDSAFNASRDIKYIEYHADNHYEHESIHLDPGLVQIIRDFVKHVQHFWSAKGNSTK